MKWIGVFLVVVGVQAAMGDVAFVDFELKRIFPREIAGMTCDTVEKYNDAFGYTLFYSQGTALTLEVSVYDMGRTVVETGHQGAGVLEVLKYCETQLTKQQGHEEISKLKKRGSSVMPPKGKTQFSNLVFQYAVEQAVSGVVKPVSRIRSIYVTGAHNNFFVAELDWEVSKGKEAKAAVEALVRQMVQIIDKEPSDQELLLAACDATIGDPASYAGQVSARHVFSIAQTMGDLSVYEELFAWPSGYRKPKNANLLMAAYFAGMLQVVVPQNLDSGGEQEAFDAMLRAYQTMRAKDQIKSITTFDEWLTVTDSDERYKKALIDCEYLAP
jgi:hypothetical protein